MVGRDEGEGPQGSAAGVLALAVIYRKGSWWCGYFAPGMWRPCHNRVNGKDDRCYAHRRPTGRPGVHPRTQREFARVARIGSEWSYSLDPKVQRQLEDAILRMRGFGRRQGVQ